MNHVNSVDAASECINKVLSLQVKPTAICCMNDLCAINSIHAAALSGVRVPEDLSMEGI